MPTFLMPVEMLVFYLCALFVLGACIGSFLNVVIYRTPLLISVDKPRRSFCPTCVHPLAWYDNIPILAWFYLRGQCRYCGTAYGFRYPLVETLTGILFVLVGYRFGLTFAALVYLVLTAVFVVIFFIDLDHAIIPSFLIWIGGGVAVVALLGATLVPAARTGLLNPSWAECLMGAAAGFAALWLIRLLGSVVVGKEAMGLGDLDLMALFGGVLGWPALLPILMLASFVGAFVGIIVKYTQRLGAYAEIPFGPFLVTAAMAYLLFGIELRWLALWYMGLEASVPAAASDLQVWPGWIPLMTYLAG